MNLRRKREYCKLATQPVLATMNIFLDLPMLMKHTHQLARHDEFVLKRTTMIERLEYPTSLQSMWTKSLSKIQQDAFIK